MGTIEGLFGGSYSGLSNMTENDGDVSGNGPTVSSKLPCTNFLIKLYKMVDDKMTNSIISWGSSCNTFIISDKQRFISEILPCYLKIKHFANFTYQLNSYGFKKKDGDRLEFEHGYFQKGKQHLLKNIKRQSQPLTATKKISKPTLSVGINGLEALFVKVKHTQKHIKNKIHRLKDDIGTSLSEVKSIIEHNSHKLISTFNEGRKRKLVNLNLGIDFVDIKKDIELMYDRFDVSMTHIDGFMALSDFIDKMAKEHKDNDKGDWVGDVRRVPQFLHKLYDMVEKKEIDSFVSWNLPNRISFIIQDINKFATEVLPMYFSHTNFSSFVTQLNIYGFKKISWEHHEYANEWFQGGRSNLLVNIMRRDKNPLLTRSTIKFSMIEVEIFMEQLKTIEQEQKNKIICLSNYEEEMKSMVHDFRKIVLQMSNIVNKIIPKSNVDLEENLKKPKMDIEDNVIDDLTSYIKGKDLDVDGPGGSQIISSDNNNVETQPSFLDFVIDLEAMENNMKMEETAWIAKREMEQYYRPWKIE